MKLRATDPAGLAGAWTVIEGIWADTVARARALPAPLLGERVDEVRECLHVILNEEWEDNRYAVRDLEVLLDR